LKRSMGAPRNSVEKIRKRRMARTGEKHKVRNPVRKLQAGERGSCGTANRRLEVGSSPKGGKKRKKENAGWLQVKRGLEEQ